MRLFLNKHKSKKASNKNMSLNLKLNGVKRLLPQSNLYHTINEVELYNDERKSSNIIRLTCSVNTVCSNVLFNKFTEIVKDEGTDNCKVLNFDNKKALEGITPLLMKNTDDLAKPSDAIRDTQLSSSKYGFSYHCGLDIFNNHILRSKTFKTICLPTNTGRNKDFNTIKDYMRSYDGKNISGHTDSVDGTDTKFKQHLYLAEDVYSFAECIQNNLAEQNGWYGFINVGKFPTYDKDNQRYDIYKVINSRKSCDFINMYPGKDLFSPIPKYNPFYRRVEKNWNYCLTYPSSATTNVGFIETASNLNSLKIFAFNDNIKNLNGTNGIKIISVSKHGLKKGDYINFYNTINNVNQCIIYNAEVATILDDYTFTIYNDKGGISQQWYKISTDDFINGSFEVNGTTYLISQNKTYIFKKDEVDKHIFIIDKNMVNLDSNMTNLSYKQVVDGEEVEYYVRIFSRLPNFKYASEKISEEKLYPIKSEDSKLAEYQTNKSEFENHISKLAFSKNIYNDDIAEIVFTDDIDISMLRDNLGRPLSEIYLSFFKNNKGYKDWYSAKNNGICDHVTSGKTIEYSHCFGKLTCAFRLSKESLANNNYQNSIIINNIDTGNQYHGLNMRAINNNRQISDGIGDEIQYNSCDSGIMTSTINDDGEYGIQFVANNETYDGDINFYGDLCKYSQQRLQEISIQQVEYRFNTAQREANDSAHFGQLVYDEFASDDYDYKSFSVEEKNEKVTNGLQEGYVYYPHYRIPIKSFSDEIYTERPIFVSIKSITSSSIENNKLTIVTTHNHNLQLYDIITIKCNRKHYQCRVTQVTNERKFVCYSNDIIDNLNVENIKLIKASPIVPQYAKLSTNGSSYYIWRELIPNGFDNNSEIEQYPFVNGAFYINKNINIFVKRQDPNNFMGRETTSIYSDPKPRSYRQTDNYYEEDNFTC